ncbi:MAG: DUF2029 domain-containing protein [Candidatus Pacebacteria bacterium]|nr:DUF2029 domain-containing protein [Candidatus Paceibacterota bacterium]
MKRLFFKIGLIGLLLRLVLMPISAHPDIWSLDIGRFFFVKEGVFDIYRFLSPDYPDRISLANYGYNFYTYPPLTYFTLGLAGKLLSPFYQADLTQSILANYPRIFHLPGIKKHLFLLKLPYLFFDLGILWCLTQLFDSGKQKKRVFWLWVFNPLSFYSAYLVGQFELIPLFFVVLSLVLAKKGKSEWATVALGVGGAYKMFPLFFLPVLAACMGKEFWQKIKLMILGAVPFFLSIAPFLRSTAFRQVVLFSKQSQKILHSSLPLSGAESIYLFVFVWGLIFLAAWQKADRNEPWFYYLAVMLAFFSLTHYHPQWFVWLTPFLFIQLVKSDFKQIFLAGFMLASWLIITLFFESSLNYGLFVPLKPSLWEAPSLAVSWGCFYDIFQLKSILRSLFAAASLVLVLASFNWQDEKN